MLLEIISFEKIFKTVAQKFNLQYDANYLGSCPLVTRTASIFILKCYRETVGV